MASDRFSFYSPGLNSPISFVFAIAPDDASDLPEITRALYIGGAGNIRLVARDGGTVTYANVPAGSRLPIRASRVLATGTTATNIIGEV
ncbi:spike base protein, RCAP_Rcc01079 family [Pseudomonas caspiana]|uniref:spike base protein, RCAP_Rcc01079 family n=1 Tax=Pseudomonas caspiana TaxID=1451454 RepID=UPI00385D92BD